MYLFVYLPHVFICLFIYFQLFQSEQFLCGYFGCLLGFLTVPGQKSPPLSLPEVQCFSKHHYTSKASVFALTVWPQLVCKRQSRQGSCKTGRDVVREVCTSPDARSRPQPAAAPGTVCLLVVGDLWGLSGLVGSVLLMGIQFTACFLLLLLPSLLFHSSVGAVVPGMVDDPLDVAGCTILSGDFYRASISLGKHEGIFWMDL